MAWGFHSADDDFEVVDRYLAAEAPQWRPYAFASMQSKDAEGRDARYARWGSGTTLQQVAAELCERPIKWSRL